MQKLLQVRKLVLLVMLITGAASWGQGTLSSPIFSENFGTIANGTSLSTSNTAFSYVRVGTSTSGSTVTNQIIASNPGSWTGSSALIGAKGGSISTLDKTGLTSFSSGTFTLKFKTPASLTSTVLFSAVGSGSSFGSANGFTGAQLSAGFQVNAGSLQIRSSSGWTSVQTLTASTNYEITIVFNNTAGTLTYGSSRTLPSNKAHLWLNGSYVGEYSAATSSLAATAFRVYTTTAQFEVDDVAVYNSLPTSSNSSSSKITRNTSFAEPTDIAYALYQATDITGTGNSVEVGQFILQDGDGSTNDSDALGTTLTDIAFTLTGNSALRRLAIYDGTTEVGEVAVSGTTATFSSISLAAADNGSKTFSLRATFAASVTDNTQFSFTVSSATASSSGSTFAASNAGAAATSTSGNSNRIEVTADRLAFSQQPTTTSQGNAMTPAVIVSANDALGNRDLDFASAVTITSTGTLTGSPVSATAASGLATFSTLTHTAPGTALTLSAQSTGLTSATSGTFNITGLEPEINVKQGATSYAVNSTYSFGSQVATTSSSAITFTIENTGTAALTLSGSPKVVLSGANAADFTVNESSTSASVAASGTTTFTVTFTPSALGARTATLTIANNDTDESSYVVNLSGTGTASAASDIYDAGTYSSNIDYTAYQTAATPVTNTSGSIGVFQFKVRDGGATLTDADNLGTTLSAITFNVSGISNIRNAALSVGNSIVAGTPVINTTNGTIAFTGLTINAADNSESALVTLRVSFNTSVTDNAQLTFTVASATANAAGSGFAAANAGGAASSTTSDRNRIEVTASKIQFGTQPAGGTVGANIAAFTVQATDANNNLDLDHSNTITLTTSGTSMTASASYALTNGVATISNVQFSSAQNNITITATATGLTTNTATSDAFSISTVATGTYRTLTAGTWPSSGTATWEMFNGTTWVSGTPSASTSNLMIITKAITVNASFGASAPGSRFTIANGGKLSTQYGTIATMLVENGGTLEVTGTQFTIDATSGTLTVESGGTVVINSATVNLADAMWNGTENFKDGSILEIQNWDWDSATGEERLIDSAETISTNADGYYFGNIYFNAAPAKAFVFVGLTGTQKLCQNNLTINNLSSSFSVILSNVNSSVTVGGNIIAQQNKFSFGSFSSANVTDTVNGSLQATGGTIDLNQTNSGSASVTVNLLNNVAISSGSLISTDSQCKIVFAGSSTQTLDLTGTLGDRVGFEVANGATAQLLTAVPFAGSNNSFTVSTGGTLDFNGFNITGSGSFTLADSGILKITSADGVNATGSTGNVQATTRSFSQLGHYYYTGAASPQATGTAMTSGSTAKLIVVDKANATDIVNLTQSTGTSNKLYIKKGDFRETASAAITGSGEVQADATGTYRVAAVNVTIPQQTGAVTFASGSTLVLNGAGAQVLRGARDYANLSFEGSGTKTTSSAISNINGTVTVKTGVTLNADNNTFGGNGTNLTLEAGSVFANGGSGTKPDISGTYTLAPTSTVEFTGSAATNIRTSPSYGNVTVSGTNTGLSTDTASLTLQSGSTFTVKAGATFNVRNQNGFTGGAATAISNVNSPTVSLETDSTINYNRSGAQTVSASVNHSNVKLSGLGAKTLENNIVIGNNLTLESGATVSVASGNNVTVNNQVINNAAVTDFVLQNNANLLQVNNVSNTGNVTQYRNSSALYRQDYTMWSSPVANQNLLNFSPNTSATRFYTYNTGTDTFASVTPGSTNFEAGRGYLIRMPNLAVDGSNNPTGTLQNGGSIADYQAINATMIFNGKFQGNPNNGTIPVTLTDAGTGFNMVGNPYPSPISISTFLSNNSTVLDGTVWIWRKKNAASGTSAYITCNASGVYVANGQPEQENPAGIIRTGQGFIVKLKDDNASSVINFDNTMRSANVSDQFFRMSNVSETVSGMPERHGVWLDLSNGTEVLSQLYAGYIEGATMGADNGIDSRFIGDTQTVLDMVIDSKEHIIQGRPLPFSPQDIIPLNFKAQAAGSYSVSLSNVEGLFANGQDVFIKDKLTGAIQNLNEGNYSFTSDAGTFSNRFEVVFNTTALGTDNPEAALNNVVVYQNATGINITAGNLNIKDVTVYDVRGRQVYSAKAVNAATTVLSSIQPAQQLLIVEVVTEAGKTTRKIVY